MDYQSQLECARTSSKIQTIKAAMTDQDKLLHILKSMALIPKNHYSEIHHDQLEDIISTLKTPGKPSAPSTRASKKKEREWALLPNLALGKQKGPIRCRREVIATRAKQQEIRMQNAMKQWVVEEDNNYLLQPSSETFNQAASP